MTRPTVTATTERMYARLPALYRAVDDQWTLLAFLSLWGDQIGDAEQLVDRIDYATADEGLDGGTSDLVDPITADADWLPWLAQLFGISPAHLSEVAHSWAQISIDKPTWTAVDGDFDTWAAVKLYGNVVADGLTGPEQLREQIAAAATGFWTGSQRAWRALLEPLLTDGKTVVFEPNVAGDPWHLNIVTFTAETPLPAAVAAVVASTPHPAGLVVTYETRDSAHWSDIESDFALWSDVDDGFDTWADTPAWIP